MQNFNATKSTTPILTDEKWYKKIYPQIRLNTNFSYLNPFLRDKVEYGNGIKAIALGFTQPLDFEQREGAFEFKIIEPENTSSTIKDAHKSIHKVSWSKNNFDFMSETEKEAYIVNVIKTVSDGHTFALKRAVQKIFGATITDEAKVFSPSLKKLLDAVKIEFDKGNSVSVQRLKLLETIRKTSYDLQNESTANTFLQSLGNYSYTSLEDQIIVMSQSTYDKLVKVPTTELPSTYTLPKEPLIIPNIPDDKVFIGDKRIISIYPQYFEIFQTFNENTLLYNLILHAWDRIGVFGVYAGKIIKITN